MTRSGGSVGALISKGRDAELSDISKTVGVFCLTLLARRRGPKFQESRHEEVKGSLG